MSALSKVQSLGIGNSMCIQTYTTPVPWRKVLLLPRVGTVVFHYPFFYHPSCAHVPLWLLCLEPHTHSVKSTLFSVVSFATPLRIYAHLSSYNSDVVSARNKPAPQYSSLLAELGFFSSHVVKLACIVFSKLVGFVERSACWNDTFGSCRLNAHFVVIHFFFPSYTRGALYPEAAPNQIVYMRQ